MMVRLSLFFGCFCAGLMLNGCAANDPRSMQFQSAEKLDGRTTNEILDAYAFETKMVKHASKTSKLRHELEQRALFTPDQWSLIDAGKVRIGEPEHAVWASWGTPDDVNTLTTASGERRALSWRKLSSIVYIEDGKVAAILD